MAEETIEHGYRVPPAATGNAPERIMQYFEPKNVTPLTGPEVVIWSRYYDLACVLVATLTRTPERTVALRKLLESRDDALRALVAQP